MKSILRQLVIYILVWLLCFPSLAFSQQPKENITIRAEDLFGKWRSEADGSVIEIGLIEKESKGIVVKGKHVWAGSYDGKKLEVIRKVAADEMDDKAPPWAREEVAKQQTLYWKLELAPALECGELKLAGKWFRGELSWREEKDSKGVVKREAHSGGKYVNPVDINYTRVGPGDEDDSGWVSEPVLMIRSQVRPVSEAIPDSLFAKEPFTVELRLPKALAAKKGGKVVVTLKSRKGADSTTLELKENGGTGFTRFDNLFPVTLAAGSEYDTFQHKMLSIEKEDVIEFSAEGVTAEVRVFQTQIAQAVDRAKSRLDDLYSYNSGLKESRDLTAADKKVVDTKLRIIDNARRVIQLKDNSYVQFSVAKEHLYYLLDPLKWKNPQIPIKVKFVNGEPIPELMEDPGLPGVKYGSQPEKDVVTRGIENGKVDALQSMVKALSLISCDLILFAISTTGADQFVILVFGISPTGEPVDLTGRVLAGISLGSQVLLTGSLAARQYAKLARQSQDAAKLFETQVIALERSPILGGVGGGPKLAAGSNRAVARRSAVIPAEEIIGAEVDLEKVKPPTNEQAVLPGAKLVKKGGFQLQRFDDTCGLAVGENIRQKKGLPARTEAENMATAYKEKIEIIDEAGKKREVGGYRPGYGTYVEGQAKFLAREGFEVKTPGLTGGKAGTPVTLGDIEFQLSKGRDVSIMIDTAGPGAKPFLHWVEVEEIVHHPDGTHTVVYGDPWTGNVWSNDSCLFYQRMDRYSAVYSRWNRGLKKP